MPGDRGAGDDGCRYCGIRPEQEMPRPSYYEMRREVERLRDAAAEARSILSYANRNDECVSRAFDVLHRALGDA